MYVQVLKTGLRRFFRFSQFFLLGIFPDMYLFGEKRKPYLVSLVAPATGSSAVPMREGRRHRACVRVRNGHRAVVRLTRRGSHMLRRILRRG